MTPLRGALRTGHRANPAATASLDSADVLRARERRHRRLGGGGDDAGPQQYPRENARNRACRDPAGELHPVCESRACAVAAATVSSRFFGLTAESAMPIASALA